MSPIIGVSTDPVKEEQAKREAEKKQALAELEVLSNQKMTLQRPVFFVPGWAGEEGKCWTGYTKVLKDHQSVKFWINRIVCEPSRSDFVSYLKFTRKESLSCPTFLEFAELLKAKVREAVSPSEPIDLIGHSMGGLDIIAGLTLGDAPLENPVVNGVAVGSPLQGIFYGKLVPKLRKLLPGLFEGKKDWQDQHYQQLKNLDVSAEPIRLVNQLDLRRRFLERVERFYQILGTQDAVVGRNARLKTEGLLQEEKRQISELSIVGATHNEVWGVTHDPRTIVALMRLLVGMPVESLIGNKGFIFGSPI